MEREWIPFWFYIYRPRGVIDSVVVTRGLGTERDRTLGGEHTKQYTDGVLNCIVLYYYIIILYHRIAHLTLI